MITNNELVRSLRGLARHVALDALAAWERAATLGGRRIHILLLHHLLDEELAQFRRLLQSLAAEYQFVDYSTAVLQILENRIEGNYLAFSFDDGLACGLRAAGVLEEFGARACYFVCPSIVGERNPAIVARFCRDRLSLPPQQFLDWSDIEQLIARGHEIGGHTMQHFNLSQIASAEAGEEIHQTYAVLRTRVGPVKHFAWPYGRFADMNRAAVQAVFEAGFHSCASGVRGCHVPAHSAQAVGPFRREELCLRRESIVAGWPLSHIRFFLSRSARQPLAIHNTWPAALRPALTPVSHLPCTSPSTPSRSSPAAA